LTDEERTEREIAREHAAEDKRRADEEKKIEEKAEAEDSEVAEDANEPGMWDESFKTHKDSKPRGPESIGMDMNFIGYKYIYGIPEHADRFWLKDTKNTDPYRLYNLDVFEYRRSSLISRLIQNLKFSTQKNVFRLIDYLLSL